jgi:precorrin-6B methylase 2
MNLFIAIPAFDSKITTKCANSLLWNYFILRNEGHRIMPYFHDGDAFIDQARNKCINIFLQTDCTDLIFIDADVAFERDSILKLLKYDKDIVAGCPPRRMLEKNFPVEIEWDSENNCREEETGFMRVSAAPTGFMKIKRQVFDRMNEYYKLKKDDKDILQFFDTGIKFENDNKWYGEDIYFCKRWKGMGGEIFVETNINFIHTGTMDFEGNLYQNIMKCKSTFYDKVEDGLPGWTTKNELLALGSMASKSKSVVEIGSWKGRSTEELLESCKGTVYAIDHWNGSGDEITGALIEQQNVYKEFINNVGHYPNLKVIKKSSLDAVREFNDKVDMVFIDGGHSYEDCRDDINAWLPKCTKYICGHDYNWPGVKKAVDEKFDKINLIDSLWWVEL